LATFSTAKDSDRFLAKKWVGLHSEIFGEIFFAKSSGHPGRTLPKLDVLCFGSGLKTRAMPPATALPVFKIKLVLRRADCCQV
jgi:hypothetical protein